MDESQSLDALSNLLTELDQNPYNIAIHTQYIRLVQSSDGLEEQLQPAYEMLTSFLAAGDDVWLPLIEGKEKEVDLTSESGVEELLSLYEKAESDYLSIPILRKHIEFLLHWNAHYAEEPKPESLGEIFSDKWTRSAAANVIRKGAGHLSQSHQIWDPIRDWELEKLSTASPSQRESLVAHVDSFLFDRIKQPHSNHEETFQAYSTFTSNYKPPGDYENLLVTASKIRAQAVKSFERRGTSENALAQTKDSLDSYARYIAAERRARNPDLIVMGAVYERAIAEAARRRFSGEEAAEVALRAFWVGYIDALRINGAGEDTEGEVFRRAIRSVPGSGEVWARYMRFWERVAASREGEDEPSETVADIYNKALEMKALQSDAEQLVPFILARAGFEKRRIEAGKADEDAFATLVKVLEAGIDMVRATSSTGDPRLRLEKYLTEIYLHLADLPESALAVWKMAVKHYKNSYLAWTSYTDVLIKQDHFDQARSVFRDIAMKNLDWPEAVWEAWISFEHLYGAVDEIDESQDRIDKAQYQVNTRRAREAEKASYQAAQMAAEFQAANVPVTEAIASQPQTVDAAMDVDESSTEHRTKRKAEEPDYGESHKKARIEQKPAPLKRDRENSTVFVADLPDKATEDELKDLFKDCGRVREVKITRLNDSLVATVEFFDRDSVPAALTKDKKRLREQEVAVHLAWKCTLYVTNFPEKADDPFMRNLFGKYGIIFDVRWPSKKFKNSRRFCYVQYTSPSAAEKALELHGQELEPGLAISVLLSNPERKKERTDQDANEREVYVAGLSKFTNKADLEKLFSTYGTLKEVRMATEVDGNSKGFAFVEFEQEKDALAALAANNYELKKRRIAVTLADSRVRSRNRNVVADTGLSRLADVRSRSIRIRNLPPATQEGLLQQVLEKAAPIKRVEVFLDVNEAVVELENAAEAGKLLLRAEPIIFNGNTLELTEEGQDGVTARAAAPSNKAGGLFVPRAAKSRPRAGLGRARKPVAGNVPVAPGASASQAPLGQGKGQDDFRKMLG